MENLQFIIGRPKAALRLKFWTVVLASFCGTSHCRAPVGQLVKSWPTDLADSVRSPLEAKSVQP